MLSSPIGKLIVAACLSLLLAACGGGSGSSTLPLAAATSTALTGVFLDKPVAGLYYVTASGLTGTTNAKGEFQYRYVGETVTFSIDGVVPVGSVAASAFVHVYDLDKPLFNDLANNNVKRAQLMQSLDSNSGQSEFIQLPVDAAKKLAMTPLNYATSQAGFDVALKNIINQLGLPASAFVSASQAKADADQYVASAVSNVCPVALPSLPNEPLVDAQYRLHAGTLTCLDKAKLNYYYANIEPLLREQREIGTNAGNALERSIKAKEAFEKNVLDVEKGLFDSLDAGLNTANAVQDAAKKGQVATVFLTVGTGLNGVVAGLLDAGTAAKKLRYGNGEDVADIEVASKKFQLIGSAFDAVAAVPDCTGIAGASADLGKCLDLMVKVINEQGIAFSLSDLSEDDKRDLKSKLKIITDTGKLGAAAFSSTLLTDSPKYLRKVGKATLTLANDSVTLALKEKVRQQGGVPGIGDRIFSVISEKLMPNLIRLADCLDPNRAKDPLAKARCVVSQWESTVTVISNGIVAYYNLAQLPFEYVDAANAVGRTTNAVVTGAMLEEVLWAGTVGIETVFAKYGVTPSGNANDDAWNLAVQVGTKRYGYTPKKFAEWLGTLVAVASDSLIYYVPPTTQSFLYYWSSLNALTDPNFNLSNVALDVVARGDGKVDVRLLYNEGVSNAAVAFVCRVPGTVEGVQQVLVEGVNSGFTTAAYATTGSKVIYCDLSLNGLHQGAKYVSFQLNVPAVPPIAVDASNVSVGQTISLWISDVWAIVKQVVWNFGVGIAEQFSAVVDGSVTAIQQTFAAAGMQVVSATFFDANGLTVGSSALSVNVSAAAIATTATITNVQSDDAAAIANNSTTSDSTPKISGTVSDALTAGQQLEVFDNGSGIDYSIGVATVAEDKTWTLQIIKPLANGSHSLSAGVYHVGYSVSGPGSPLWTFSVQSAAPTTSKLPHTGITSTQCYQSGSDTLVDCASAGAKALNSQQDGMRTNVQPMSYSLVGSYSKEECVKDNVTGLVWEGKTASGPRAGSNFYTNYDSAYFGTQEEMDASSNTYGYAAYVNSIALCGYTDWRLPTVDELQTIVDYGKPAPGPAFDTSWFGNTPFGDIYISSSPYVGLSSHTWGVFVTDGSFTINGRTNNRYVRLVRPSQ